MQIIVLLGPPGSGKGTQAELVKEKTGYPIVSSSQLIRDKFQQHSEKESPQIQKAKKQYKKGDLVDPQLFADWTLEVIEEIEQNPRHQDGVIFDGFLRTLEETKIVLPRLIKRFSSNSIKAFFLKISLTEAKQRLSTRLICSDCNKPLKPSSNLEEGDPCPYQDCRGEIVKRELDKPEIIEKRFNAYKKQTKPSLAYLKEKGVLTVIDGGQDVPAVNKEIIKNL